MAITPLPPAPLVTDSPSEFNTKAFTFVNALGDFVTETNAVATQVDADAQTAAEGAAASEAAVAAANFKGAWNSLSGALNIPASVSHNGSVYVLTANLADVTADEPGVTPSSKWIVVTIPPQTGNGGKFLTTNGTDLAWKNTNFHEAIASGTLPNGAPVIVNSDGTVSAVNGAGDPVVFKSGSSVILCSSYNSVENKILIVYYDSTNSNYGTAIVGSISGYSITFGAPVVFESASTSEAASDYSPSLNSIVITYPDPSNGYLSSIVAKISGTNVTFGTKTVVISSAGSWPTCSFDTTSGKFIFSFSSSGGKSVVGTVSGTSITVGAVATFTTSTFFRLAGCYDVNSNRTVLFYAVSGGAGGFGVVGTVSGTSISFGTPVQFTANNVQNSSISTVYDAAALKTILIYGNSTLTGIYGLVASPSGTTISYGTPSLVAAVSGHFISAIKDTAANKIIVSFNDSTNSNYGTAVVGTVSGTSISFGSKYVFEFAYVQHISMAYNSTEDKIGIFYIDGGNSSSPTAFVFKSVPFSNLTASNFIGFSNSLYTNGQTATIQTIGSIDDAQTSLTAGSAYYVKGNGVISTTAGNPSVFAGTAVSSTKIIVKG